MNSDEISNFFLLYDIIHFTDVLNSTIKVLLTNKKSLTNMESHCYYPMLILGNSMKFLNPFDRQTGRIKTVDSHTTFFTDLSQS